MGETRDLFKKIRDTKGIFYANMGTTKNRNSMDLTEPEYIQKRWKEYIEELYNKDHNDPDNHDGMIIHLEPDILESQVKWAYQAPLSTGFSSQQYWSGLSFPSPADLPDPGTKTWSSAFQADSSLSEPPGKPRI